MPLPVPCTPSCHDKTLRMNEQWHCALCHFAVEELYAVDTLPGFYCAGCSLGLALQVRYRRHAASDENEAPPPLDNQNTFR